MNNFHRKLRDLLPLLLLLLGLSGATSATEGGGSNYLPGFYGDFAMAVFPDQGTHFNNFFAGWGDRSANTGTLLEMPGVLHVTGKQVLGGNLIVGLYPALMGALDDTGKHQGRFGLGDFYLVPFALNWRWGKLTALAFEGVVAPTGRFTKNEFNLGRNVWTFDHMLLLTYELPANNELSMAIGYMNNTVNPATHYQSGDEFHFDYTLAHNLEGGFGVGVVGSYYKQVTADHAPRPFDAPPYSEAATIGPALLYTPKLGGRDVAMSVKWLHEFNVTGRAPNDYLVWRVFLPF